MYMIRCCCSMADGETVAEVILMMIPACLRRNMVCEWVLEH
jgi:hypothetical protein